MGERGNGGIERRVRVRTEGKGGEREGVGEADEGQRT